MYKISKLIFYPFIKLFFTALLSTLAVIVLMLFVSYFTDFIGRGIEVKEYFYLALYCATGALPYAMPLAVMFSSIVAMGTLAENSEIIALKAAGVSLARIVRPLVIFAIFLGGFSFLGNSYLVPRAAVRFLTLLYDIRSTKPEFGIKEGVFYDGVPGYSIRVGTKNRDKKTLSDIMIYDHTRKKSLPYLTIAKTGSITFHREKNDLIIELFDGHNYFDIAEEDATDYAENPNKFLKSNFKSQKLIINLEGFGFSKSAEDLFEWHTKAKVMSKLKNDIEILKNEINEVKDYIKKSFQHDNMDIDEEPLDANDLNAELNYQNFVGALDKNPEYRDFDYDAENLRKEVLENSKNFEKYLTKCYNYEVSKSYILNDSRIALEKMISLALSCITVMFLGISLGAVIRKGGLGMPLVISGILIVIHYIIETAAERWGKIGQISSFNAAWAANYVIIPLSILFYYLAYKDTRIMEADFYAVLFKKIFRRSKK